MARVAGLDEHLAGTLAPPGASGDLGEYRKEPLGCPVIGRNQRGVCVHDGDQSEPRKIMSLGEELRADEDVGLAAPDAFQRTHEVGPAACAVAVDAHDPRPGESLGERLFHALRAASHRL
jgi:hypothetical protein